MKTKLLFGQLAAALPQEIRDAAHNDGVKDDAEVKRVPIINPRDIELDDGSMTAVQYVSTRERDLENEVVVQDGGDFSGFMKNPVVFFGHRRAVETVCGGDKSTNVTGAPACE